jgi:protease-4
MSKFLRVILGCLLVSMLLQGCAIVVSPSFHEQKGKLREVTVEESQGWFVLNKVLLVDLSGVLSTGESGSLFGSTRNDIEEMKEILKKAEQDANIKAVILRINTPGGEVTASNILYQEVREFKKKTGKPVIAIMMDISTSGGYYVAMAADKVYALPTTLTGNIGVIYILPKLEGLASKIGIEMRVIKSADKRDMSSPWRDFSPQEREILQSLINNYFEQFLHIVAENRANLTMEKIRTLADGRIFSAQQALEAGLIDGITTLPEAIQLARRSAGISDSRVVMYNRPHDVKENIYSSSSSSYTPSATGDTQVGLINLNANGFKLNPSPRFMYLWMP